MVATKTRRVVEHSSPKILNKVKINVVRKEECLWHMISEAFGDPVNKNLLCSGNVLKGVAEGDSGGPLFQVMDGRNHSVGVTAVGPKAEVSADIPSGFTIVSKYIDWILDTIDEYG